MNKIISLRQLYPAVFDLNPFSCTIRFSKGGRYFGTTSSLLNSDNQDYEVNPHFVNRNPRTLEFQGIQPKRKGWKYQYPRKDYYYKVQLNAKGRAPTGWVEHWTGEVVVKASSKEWSIRKHLHSPADVSAMANLGALLARRCLEAGITNVFYDEEPGHAASEKMQAFLKALKEGQLELTEPDVAEDEYEAGIDYDKPNRYAEKKVYKDDYQIA